MSDDIINILLPPIFLVFFGFFCFKKISTSLKLCALFFTSIAAFSQNFSLIFRELHQLIQLIILFFWIVSLLKTYKQNKTIYFLVIFSIFMGISFIGAPIDQDARTQVINFIVVFGVIGFLFNSLKNKKDLEIILVYFSGLAFITACSGLIEFLVSSSARIEGTFANPNYFALFIGLGWVPVFVYYRSPSKYFCLCIMTLAIILSGSRAALLFPILYLIWRIYLNGNIIKMFFYSTLSVLILSLILLSGATRFTSESTKGSDAERIIFAKIAINMALEHPYTGVGWGRFITEFSNYAGTVDKIILDNGTIDASNQERRVTHNDLLRILSELGFIAFIFSLYFLFRTGLLIRKFKGFGMEWLFPCWCGMIIFSLTHNNLNTALSWFFILLPWFLYSKEKKSPRSSSFYHLK